MAGCSRCRRGAIRVRSEVLSLPLPEFTPEEIEQARATLSKPAPTPRVSMDHVHALKVLDVAGRQGKPLDAEVQVIALGDEVAWVALPGEMFVELGLDMKRRSPFKHTIIVELANGSVGYVPTKRARSRRATTSRSRPAVARARARRSSRPPCGCSTSSKPAAAAAEVK